MRDKVVFVSCERVLVIIFKLFCMFGIYLLSYGLEEMSFVIVILYM